MLEYHSLNDLIYEEIKKRIISNEYPPQQRLEIDTISQELGVSRTPIVNALKALAKDGYVIVVPRSGTYVRKYSLDEIEALFEFREALECVVVRKSILLADEIKLKKFIAFFEIILDNINAHTSVPKIDDYYDLQTEFHSYLWNLCPAIISNELQNIVDLTKRICQRHLLFSHRQAGADKFFTNEIQTHISLAQAILDRDEASAETLIRRDIDQTKRAILDHYNEIEAMDI